MLSLSHAGIGKVAAKSSRAAGSAVGWCCGPQSSVPQSHGGLEEGCLLFRANSAGGRMVGKVSETCKKVIAQAQQSHKCKLEEVKPK